MPLDRRKQQQPLIPFSTVAVVSSDNDDDDDDDDDERGTRERRMLWTWRDVAEQTHQQRLQQQQQRQARRRKIHRNRRSYRSIYLCGYSVRTDAVQLLLVVLFVLLTRIAIVSLFWESNPKSSASSSWLRVSLLPWWRNRNHEQHTGHRHQERAVRQVPQGFTEHNTNHTTSRSNPNSRQSSSIAWLMSFPNSGTSYTMRLVRDVSQTPTASNYADETPVGTRGLKQAVFPDQPTGPFWILDEEDTSSSEGQQPIIGSSSKYVLTKTHCGIRCNPCSPEEMAETTYSFRRRCLVTKWVTAPTGTNQYSTYPTDRVHKAVHLFRDPLDNVVSRFHLINQQTGHKYTADKLGFLKYCMSIDYQYTESETRYMHFAQNKLLSALWKVPCHADFLRYVEWHNLAFVTQTDLQLDTFLLSYEDFGKADKFNTTLQALLDFLELPVRAAPTTPFVQGKSYRDYFAVSETKIIRDALHFAASRQTWEQIRGYFGDA